VKGFISPGNFQDWQDNAFEQSCGFDAEAMLVLGGGFMGNTVAAEEGCVGGKQLVLALFCCRMKLVAGIEYGLKNRCVDENIH